MILKKSILLFVFFILCVIFLTAQNSSNRIETGKIIFTQNCAPCHSLTRPLLQGMQPLQHIRDRRGKEYVYQFVWNNMKLLASGNKTALKVYYDAQRTAMNIFPSLTKNDIDAICDYIDTQPLFKNK